MKSLSFRVLFIVVLMALAFFVVFTFWHLFRERGKIEIVQYDSKTGSKGTMVVYLPPGYSKDEKYLVLYLLHGAGDDETAWRAHGSVGSSMDKLFAAHQIVPMIVVMPNAQGRSSALETDLLDENIPYIELHFAARTDREGRAIAGVSMGGGQALFIGLSHPDTFAWVGGFSSSLTGKNPGDLVADRPDNLSLLWISCGDEDHLLDLNKSIHALLEEKNIRHEWLIGSNGHEWRVWRGDLEMFAVRLFR